MQPNYNYQKNYWEKDKNRRTPRNKVIKAFVEPKIDYINKILNVKELTEPLSLMDIGCGNGFFTFYLEKYYNTFALDFSVTMLKSNPASNKICASADKLPFNDKSFDVLFCSNLLHHVDRIEEVIIEMQRVSRKYIILSEPNRDNPLMFLFGMMKKAERGTLKFSLKYMENILKKFDLNIISSLRTGIVLPNMTPEWLLPLLNKYDGNYPLGFYNMVISERKIS